MTLHYTAVKTSIDAFSSGSTPSSTIWTNLTGADVTIVSTQLDTLDRLIASGNAVPGVMSKATFDVTRSIIAFKWRTPTGTHTSTTEFDLELDDSAGNLLGCAMLIGQSSGGGGYLYDINAAGASQNIDSGGYSTGLGLGLADGTWVGIGFLDGKKVRVFTSTDDGATWSLFRELTYVTNFGLTAAKVALETYHETSSDVAGWHSRADEVALFRMYNAKVRVGGAWVGAYAKARVGGAWVHTTPKRRVGGAWV